MIFNLTFEEYKINFTNSTGEISDIFYVDDVQDNSNYDYDNSNFYENNHAWIPHVAWILLILLIIILLYYFKIECKRGKIIAHRIIEEENKEDLNNRSDSTQ